MAEAETEEKDRKKVEVPDAEEGGTELQVVDGGGGSAEAALDDSDKKKLAHECTQRLRDARDKVNELYIDVSRDIWLVNRHNLYIFEENPETGEMYNSFKEYVDWEVPYGIRKAHYLVNLWEHYVEGEGDGEEDFLKSVEDLGVSKLIILTDVINEENRDEWMEIAEKKSCRELQQYVDNLLSDDSEEEPTGEDLKTEQLNQVNFQLYDDQKANWEAAAKVAQSQSGSDKKGELLDLICLDYLSHNQGAEAKQKPKSYYLKNLERVLGCKIMAFDESDIIYGIESLDDAIAVLDESVTVDEAEGEF
jgi:hypothetical protein